jgi:hypothetical protein
VLLRAGAVPSTTGVTGSNGTFDLLTRPGDFQAVILPPAKTGLPEARIAAGDGLVIYDPPPPRVALDFAWATFDTSALDLTVRKSDDTAVAGPVRVRLESAAGSLPRAGTLTIDKQFKLTATGFVQRDATSDTRGAVSFADLPRGTYTATLTPLDGSAAITTVAIDLTAPQARVAQNVRLARKITFSGKLQPVSLTAGATLLALDDRADPTGPTPSAIISSAGAYSLALDPGRTYSLVLEAAPAQAVPRSFLRLITAPMKDSTREDLVVPPGLEVSGVVTNASGVPVVGALVEAYCMGLPPACIDARAPDVSNVRPTAEAVSDGSGAYRLLVPDPKIAN